jgi:tRNA threonylcarbamoyladenosine biosynthesis protein TsaE
MKKISKNISENKEIAEFFLNKILEKPKNTKGATVVALSGDLGAGKTSFTQATALHLGIKNKINSPTFVLIKKYKIKNKKYKFLFHIDAYRLKNEQELLYLGWEDIIGDKEHLVFIEWPERVKKVIPKGSVPVKISHTKEGYRKFEFR